MDIQFEIFRPPQSINVQEEVLTVARGANKMVGVLELMGGQLELMEGQKEEEKVEIRVELGEGMLGVIKGALLVVQQS